MHQAGTIIVLHKSGEPSHYRALVHAANANGVQVVFREFSIISKLFKGIIRFNGSIVKKQLVNLTTLISLWFSKNKFVVLGIAPYDSKLIRILKVLKNHHVYYHTSWPIWDGTDYPKRKKVTNKVLTRWKQFLEKDVEHIYTVTATAKESLLENYQITAPITVVGHSYDPSVFKTSDVERIYDACYAGRLVSEKGIDDLLKWSQQHPEFKFAFMGSGDDVDAVKTAANQNDHLHYLPASQSAVEVSRLFQQSDYLILYARRTQRWQELFGMVIIEAMACGCIPITTDHVGPKEIIDHAVNGYIFEEDVFIGKLASIMKDKPSAEMKIAARKRASDFAIESISSRWINVVKNAAYA
ncbi:glycosyltransferase [Nonlabens ponticola]|uniref:Glycosyltransferase n=1 Tax=Nonlabens ponticola TaxID=2496866 RepID=A0A3S9MX02_9FLAO|nr:glycosyltransferase [Nonlabens ponticola]AZQ43751.1 glycosyltransferase [Nonlabens ponticola]